MFFPVLLNEFYGAFSISGGELILASKICNFTHLLIPFNKGKDGILHLVSGGIFQTEGDSFKIDRPHIIGIRYPEIFIESMLEREEYLMMSKVPLSDYPGVVTLCFQYLGNGCLFSIDAVCCPGHQGAGNADPVRITSGDQSCS